MTVPFVSFNETNKVVKKEILLAFEEFFDKAWYVLGDGVRSFEEAYAKYNNVLWCVGVSNGLDALHIALKTLDIGKGDEVIVPSNTYIASALAVSYVGATPVFVEPNINTYNIDASKIEQAITKKTKAIMPVHLYGQACDMKAIMNIAEKHGLFVVEDNAQSQGAEWNKKFTGSWGHINGTSFYPGKNLGAYGDAGAVTTNDEELKNKAIVLRNYGSVKKYYNEVIGFNMRLDECQANFLSIKLRYLNEWTRQRQEIAEWYNSTLKNVGDLILPYVHANATHVYHLYVIRTQNRDALQQHLSQLGIGSLIHYPIPPYLQKAYAYLGYKNGDYPLADEIANTCISIPLWPGMRSADVEIVSKGIEGFFK